MKIWAHTLVKNEERYLWFAVKSVVDYVDRILIWDTDSTDRTVDVIEILKKEFPRKIDFKEIGTVGLNSFTSARNDMLNESLCDWIMLLDGDEVWWKKNIERARDLIHRSGDYLESLVHRTYNVIGDIYHYQEEKAGRYNIDDEVGHLNIRFFSKNIPGIKFIYPHGREGVSDEKNTLIQNRLPEKRFHTKDYYMHLSFLRRAGEVSKEANVPKRTIKYKYELGKKFPKDFKYPEVFYDKRPDFILNPWEKRSISYFLISLPFTPIKKIRRRVIKHGKVGY